MVSAVSELEQLTRAAERAADGSPAGAEDAVAALPWLAASIRRDRAAGRFATWGLSTIIDENTGAAVIPRALFEELHRSAGIAAEWPIGNAGLLHCYGYLLSVEATPYGLKRDRWTEGALAQACGRNPEAFLPWIDGPTLLERATEAASSLLAAPAAGARQSIDGREAILALGATAGPTALVYAVAPGADAAAALVTMFPVADASAPLEEFTRTPRLRWNAA